MTDVREVLATNGHCAYCNGKMDATTLVCVRRSRWQQDVKEGNGSPMWGMCKTCFHTKRQGDWCELRKLFRSDPHGGLDVGVVAEVTKDPPYP